MKIGVLLIGTGMPPRDASQEDLADYVRIVCGVDGCARHLDPIGRNLLKRITVPAKTRRWHKNLTASSPGAIQAAHDSAASLAEKLDARLIQDLGANACVAIGMVWGTPSIEEAAHDLMERDCDTIIIVPLFPFYYKPLLDPALERSQTALTKSSTRDRTPRIAHASWLCENPAFRQALVKSIERDWSPRSSSRLLVLMPSQPKSLNETDDTYRKQIESIKEHLDKKLDIGTNRIQLSFICDFDNGKWMGPFAEKTLLGWAGGAVSDVRAICPLFTDANAYSICEADSRLREYFASNSFGLTREYALVDALENDDVFAGVLSDVIQKSVKRL